MCVLGGGVDMTTMMCYRTSVCREAGGCLEKKQVFMMLMSMMIALALATDQIPTTVQDSHFCLPLF